MPGLPKQLTAGPRKLAMPIAALAGLATVALVGVALAKTLTLQVARNATVMNTAGMSSHENIVVNARGRAVYELSGDSKSHPECTKANGCFRFWPPVTVGSASQLNAGAGIKGKLGVWRRDGFLQVTLGGRPLYTFASDRQKHRATGQGLKSFGGIWQVSRASRTPGGMSTLPPPSTTAPTTTTTPCLYAPCY